MPIPLLIPLALTAASAIAGYASEKTKKDPRQRMVTYDDGVTYDSQKSENIKDQRQTGMEWYQPKSILSDTLGTVSKVAGMGASVTGMFAGAKPSIQSAGEITKEGMSQASLGMGKNLLNKTMNFSAPYKNPSQMNTGAPMFDKNLSQPWMNAWSPTNKIPTTPQQQYKTQTNQWLEQFQVGYKAPKNSQILPPFSSEIELPQ